MIVIENGRKEGKKRFIQSYRFTCIYCKSRLEATEDELAYIGELQHPVYAYSCPICKCRRLVDGELLVPCG